jgi:hypothetical protein
VPRRRQRAGGTLRTSANGLAPPSNAGYELLVGNKLHLQIERDRPEEAIDCPAANDEVDTVVEAIQATGNQMID